MRRLDNDLRPLGAFEGEGSLSLPIRRLPGEQAQISDLIAAPETHPTPESLLGLQPARDTCRIAIISIPEDCANCTGTKVPMNGNITWLAKDE
jgi:hypothetical protein